MTKEEVGKPPIKDDLIYWFQVEGNLSKFGASCAKLILVGLFCPPVGQEFAECFAVILVAGDAEKDILHPLSRVHVQGLAAVHQGVDDGCTYGGIMIPTEQEVLSAQSQRPDGVLHKIIQKF